MSNTRSDPPIFSFTTLAAGAPPGSSAFFIAMSLS